MAKYTKSVKKENKRASNPTLTMVVDDFNEAWKYTSGSWHDRWERNHFLYNGQRTARSYDGIADTFVPMTFSTVETVVSALFGSKPKYDYIPPEESEDEGVEVLNGLVDYYWDKDQWSMKNIDMGRSMVKLGTGISYYYWDIDHPCKITIPLRDFFIDPTATSLDNARYVGRRYLTTLEELEGFEIVDLEAEPDSDGNLPMKKKYTNLKGLTGGKTNENTDQQEKNIWYGSTLDGSDKKQIEIIEYWTEDKVISVANRERVIEDSENYFKAKARANGDKYPKGILPFSDARDYVDESLFYAKGEVDIIADQQEMLNDLTNQYIDAITFQLNPMFKIPSEHADKVDEVESLPGATYAFDVEPINTGLTSPAAFNERINIKNEIREATASNEVVRGGSTENTATATEINAQIAGAGQRMSIKVSALENGYFHREARILFRMIQLYVTEPMMVRILGKDGANWQEFDPEKFKGEYEPRVQLDITVQQRRAEEQRKAQDLVAAFLGDPDIDQIELKKLALQRGFDLDPDEVSSLIVNREEVIEEAPEGLPPEVLPPDMMPPEMMMQPDMLPSELQGIPQGVM